jgi:hypothetical protein
VTRRRPSVAGNRLSAAGRDAWTAALTILQRLNIGNHAYAKTIELPDGPLAGSLYDPDIHPAQAAILRAIDAGASWVTIAKPVQDGGSLASFAPILRRAHAMSQNAIVAYPTMDAAKDAWAKKVWPMLERQGGTMPKSGGGSRGGAARVVTLPSGGSIILRAAGGRAESGQASVTADAMLVDEVDDWKDLRVLRLIERRLSRSRDPLIIYVSTVKRDALDGVERSRILRLYEQGSMTRLHYPCPHCGAYMPLDWGMIDREARRLRCCHCGEAITETQRLAMLPRAREVDRNDRRGQYSILWTALESPFPVLVEGRQYPVIEGLCLEYDAALASIAVGDHGLMRQFWRDRMCQPYRGDLDELEGQTHIPTRMRLAALSAVSTLHIDAEQRHDDGGDSYHWTMIPAWAEYITVGVDVQPGGDKSNGRMYFVAEAFGQGQAAIVGWGTMLAGPPGRQATEAEMHATLSRIDEVIGHWSPAVPVVSRACDVGNDGDMLLRWLNVRRGTWHPAKGTGPLVPRAGDRPGWVYYRQQDAGYRLTLIETSSVLRTLHGEILAGKGAGSVLLPHGLDAGSALVKHLCASVEYEPGKWSSSAKDRKHHYEWQARNDYADAACYARALGYAWGHDQAAKANQPRRRRGVVGTIGGHR